MSTAEVYPRKEAPTFESVLLQLASAVSNGVELQDLVVSFCGLARECFDVSGVYCWRVAGDELIGFAAAGPQAPEFADSHLKLADDSAVARAVTQRKTIVFEGAAMDGSPQGGGPFPAKSLVALPLTIAGEVTGAVVLTHDLKPNFFTDELVTKASVLAAQLGMSLETARLARASHEERRRAEAMIESASALHTKLDLTEARDGLTRRLLSALDIELVALLDCKDGVCSVASVAQKDSTGNSLLADAAGICRFGEHLTRVLERDYPLIVDLSEDPVGLPMVNSGQALVLPLKSESTTIEVIAYGGPDYIFAEQDISLARAICGVGALAIRNAQLYATTSAQANELRGLLEISSELSSIGDLDQFLKRFVHRAAEFLGFERSFIALLEHDNVCRVRYVSDKGAIVPKVIEVPDVVRKSVMATRNMFWSDDVRALVGSSPEFFGEFRISQLLVAPLFGSDSGLLGLFGVLDRRDGSNIRPQDVERARALGAQVAVVLEATRNLDVAEDHRRRSENLMSLALEVSSSIRLPDLVTSLTSRAMDMMEGKAAALALARSGVLETVYVQGAKPTEDKSLLRRLNMALTELSGKMPDAIAYAPAVAALGPSLAESLDWHDVVLARMNGSEGDLVGLLCIANRERDLEPLDRSVLQALVGHASIALDNSRLFTRIAQSNSQWVEIFDAITDFIVVHDHNNRVLRVNRSMADFIGARPAELIGVTMRALSEMSHESSSDPCPFCRNRAELTDEFVHPVLERTYLVSTSRIHASLEEGMQTIHVLKDITDRREAERRYRELFDNIQEGLFFSSPDGRFIEVNDALVRMLGYESRDELLQIDIVNDLYLAAGDRRTFQRALEEKGALRNYEEVLRRKDGALIYSLQNAFAVRDAKGNIVQYRGLMLDITELKNFQVELQRQRDFNLKILNNTQSLIMVADTAGLISYANRRCYEFGGYAPGELVGRKLAELVVPSRRHAFIEALTQTVVGQQVDNLELPVATATGKVAQLSVNLSPMRDEQGQVASIVVVMSDVSDIALLQAKLMQTEKMAAVGQLVSGVAHEVNNPLTAILGFADLLSVQEDVTPDAKHDLNIIIQEAQRTKQIVQNLLSFARQTPPQREPLDVNEILRRTFQLRAYDFSNHGIEFAESFGSLPVLVGDAHQLQQVFLNILNNAYDAVSENPRKGRVEVSTSVRGEFVEVAFADNGSGIQTPDRIFDPFYTTKDVGKGTGLGLSICYGIVREHGGEIIASNREGGGALFVVKLPVATAEKLLAVGGEKK